MNKILLFFLKCLAALVPFIALIMYTALNPLGYMDEEYPGWRYTKLVQDGKEKTGATTVILGDSRAMADIIPSGINNNTCNLSTGGATPVEMYYTLSEYIDNVGIPESVIIMFAPFHYSYMDNFWSRTVYFHHLSFPDAVRVYNEGKRTGSETMADEDHDFSDIVSMYLRLPDSYMPALLNSRFTARYEKNRDKYEQIRRDRGHALFGTDEGSEELNYEANYTEFKTDGDFIILDEYIRKLLTLCREKNILTILVQAPMNEASYTSLDPNYVGQYTDYLRSLQEAFPEVYFDMEIPCFDNELFGDASHLNEKGAEAYTDYFKHHYGEIMNEK